MDVANRLRSLREQKNLSQGDIEKRTGLLHFSTDLPLTGTASSFVN
jgi:transcriptional regulator with XRE-family HTH domain